MDNEKLFRDLDELLNEHGYTIAVAAMEETILQKLHENGTTDFECLQHILDFYTRHPYVSVDPRTSNLEWHQSAFADFVLEYMLNKRQVDFFLETVTLTPTCDMVMILVQIAKVIDPKDELLGKIQETMDCVLKNNSLDVISKNWINNYKSTIPELQPLKDWPEFGITVIQCYSDNVRKAERYSTSALRNARKCCVQEKKISYVSSRLLQENQLSVLSGKSATGAKYTALDYSKHTGGTSVVIAIEQLPYNRFNFEISIAQGKKILCEYLFASQIGRYRIDGGIVLEKPQKRKMNLEKYLSKMPEVIILDDSLGKTVQKKDLISLLEIIETGDNDWQFILEKMSSLLYGRCFPLEWPSIDITTPSTCPEGYELVDQYDVCRFGCRTEIYYCTRDKNNLPLYSR